jgi:hypothetical protein
LPPEIQCPKCKARLLETAFNQPDLLPCPACGSPLQVEVFPALFRRIAPGRDAEAVMVEGESSCFYHPQKKAIVPCDACGRFLCALCDCEVKGRHLCPGCLETGQKRKNLEGLETVRVLHSRQALLLSILPLFITGLAAIYVALRYRKEPGSLVAPMPWAFPTALILGSLQTLAFAALIISLLVK